MRANILVYYFVGVVILLTGCDGSRGNFLQIGKDFSNAYESGRKVFLEDINQITHTKRVLAVMRYINNGSENQNINKEKVDSSFARFVCAGVNEYESELDSLKVLESYQKIILNLSEQPASEVGALWRSIYEVRKEKLTLDSPKSKDSSYAACFQEVMQMFPMNGEPIERREAIKDKEAFVPLVGGLESLKTFVESLEKLTVFILQIVDEKIREEALRKFIVENSEVINKILDDGDFGRSLNRLFLRRKISSIVLPYLQFKAMLNFDTEVNVNNVQNSLKHRDRAGKKSERSTAVFNDWQKVNVLKKGEEISRNLRIFDSLRIRPLPSMLLDSMKVAERDLQRLAAGKLKSEEVWANFTIFAERMKLLIRLVQDSAEEGKKVFIKE